MSNKLLIDGLYANRVYINEDFKETLDENFCSIDIERNKETDMVHYKLYSNTNHKNTEQLFSHMSTNNSIYYYNYYYNYYYSKKRKALILSANKIINALQKLGKLREALYE